MPARRFAAAAAACLAVALGTRCRSDRPEALVALLVQPNPILVSTFNFGHGNVEWLASYTVTVRESAGVAATVTAFRAQALDSAGQERSVSLSAGVQPADPNASLVGFPVSLAASGSLEIRVIQYFGRAYPNGVPPPPYPLRFEIAVDVTDANGHSSTVRVSVGDARTGP